jgi:MFS family permease
MSSTLSKVFFPLNDPATQALSFWGVFFVGYISRPAGAVLFGHLGDTKGRGTCLLISVLVMGIPTVGVDSSCWQVQNSVQLPCVQPALQPAQRVDVFSR